jgi:hypothetical protein
MGEEFCLKLVGASDLENGELVRSFDKVDLEGRLEAHHQGSTYLTEKHILS